MKWHRYAMHLALPPIRICRPWAIATVAMIGAWSYSLVAGSDATLLDAVLLLTTLILVGLSAFPLNDAYDEEIDYLAHPERPIPAGEMSPGRARIQGLLMILSGLIAASFLGVMPFSIATICAVLILCYSPLKAVSGIGGNVITALLFGTALAFPLFSVAQPQNVGLVISMSLVAAILVLLREIVKDIEDAEIDRYFRRSTIPLVLGISTAYRISALIALLCSAILLRVVQEVGGFELVAAGVWSSSWCGLLAWRLWRSDSKNAKRRVADLKLTMVILPSVWAAGWAVRWVLVAM